MTVGRYWYCLRWVTWWIIKDTIISIVDGILGIGPTISIKFMWKVANSNWKFERFERGDE